MPKSNSGEIKLSSKSNHTFLILGGVLSAIKDKRELTCMGFACLSLARKSPYRPHGLNQIHLTFGDQNHRSLKYKQDQINRSHTQ
jgi:hypothetical protein